MNLHQRFQSFLVIIMLSNACIGAGFDILDSYVLRCLGKNSNKWGKIRLWATIGHGLYITHNVLLVVWIIMGFCEFP
eukprot:TRINITY_DN4875_c0_g1_i1.p1 TRINITY_DN4875_c0_g1~~TRINITY_DN4875_c0_g1_i1.p1  ORF type:complete len:77 (-),score=5.42 TRINITY_DN4875_c0_g1_i1:159-389(-)